MLLFKTLGVFFLDFLLKEKCVCIIHVSCIVGVNFKIFLRRVTLRGTTKTKKEINMIKSNGLCH